MFRFSLAVLVGSALFVPSAQAKWFKWGPEDYRYGPYTGGHGYSYNTAYSYGFPFQAADTWRRDLFAYPAGITPYRPYGKPITHRVFPKPSTPYIAVPGLDGLPVLIRDGSAAAPAAPPVFVAPAPLASVPNLVPPPVQAASAPAADAGQVRIVVQAPEQAEVWVGKEKLPQTGTERTFQAEGVSGGQTQVYSLRAQWQEGGQTFEQFRVVGVKAGETARVKFQAGR